MLCQVRVPPFLFRDVRRSTDQKLILRLFPKQTKHTSKDRYLTASYHPRKGNLNSVIQKILLVGSEIPGNSALMWNQESWSLESRIYLKESGITLREESRIQVPLTKNPESSTLNQESTVWNPESNTVLDSVA